jgi:CO/xanthine dehydrogenase FAD-binding subunit
MTIEIRNFRSLKEALEMLEAKPLEWNAFGGGTYLFPNQFSNKTSNKMPDKITDPSRPEVQSFINLFRFPELQKITTLESEISLGSACTVSMLLENRDLATFSPLLIKILKTFRPVAIQNRATLGGAVMSRDPRSEILAGLLVLRAKIEVQCLKSVRTLELEEFFNLGIKPGEIISRIKLPRNSAPGGIHKVYSPFRLYPSIVSLVYLKEKTLRLSFANLSTQPKIFGDLAEATHPNINLDPIYSKRYRLNLAQKLFSTYDQS